MPFLPLSFTILQWTRKPSVRRLCLIFLVLTAASEGRADTVATAHRAVTRLAEGVYAIRHPDSPDGNLNGNTTVIIGDDGVFVVDSCFQPSAASEDIAQIRRWTSKPVRYLLNTHWHNDHNMGNGAYAAAFPSIAIIAHVDTARDMYRTPNTASRFVQQIATRRQRLESGVATDGSKLTAEQRDELARRTAGKVQVLEEIRRFAFRPPGITFDHDLHIDLGNREVQVKYLGRGPTAGDAIVYLPKERIVIAGDLLTHPVMFTYDGYPSEWIGTLECLGWLDADIIVPGHGDVVRGRAFLDLAVRFLRSAVDQVAARLHELTATVEYPSLDEVRKGVDLAPFRHDFAGDDAEALAQFDDAAGALVGVVYNEAMHNRSR
jgi:cyclase